MVLYCSLLHTSSGYVLWLYSFGDLKMLLAMSQMGLADLQWPPCACVYLVQMGATFVICICFSFSHSLCSYYPLSMHTSADFHLTVKVTLHHNSVNSSVVSSRVYRVPFETLLGVGGGVGGFSRLHQCLCISANKL